MSALKPKQPKIATQKTLAFKQKLAEGRRIAEQLTIATPLGEVARQLGVSESYVRRVELLALCKLSLAVKAIGKDKIYGD